VSRRPRRCRRSRPGSWVHPGGDGEERPAAADRGDHFRGVVRGVHPDHDLAGAASGAGRADRLGGQRRRAAGGSRSAAAQPGGRDHGSAQRGRDHGRQHVQAADQQALALNLGVPERRAGLGVPVHPSLHRVDIDERQHVPAGKQQRGAGQSSQEHPADRLQLPDTAPVNDRRNDPSVDGARIPPNKAAMAPCRSPSMSSMLSAPAAIPATRQSAFRSAFTPVRAAILTCWRTSADRPHRSASAMAGTRPACDTRFGSSNDACVLAGLCHNCT